MPMIDWSKCPDAERVPDKMFGAWVVRGTRVPVQAVLDNADDGYTAEQIATDIYHGLPVEPTRRVIAFARKARVVAHSP
jgi:uncharacterized protein (DUF433 family)